ncbi:protein kinase domain-containing protein [Sorangium sp. So ce385]|uniref:protein kinase domain-containing protein n=1 Tax=Sorangium sp. So ce385 TaxID=3133308 RepID=UPI003F5B4D00
MVRHKSSDIATAPHAPPVLSASTAPHAPPAPGAAAVAALVPGHVIAGRFELRAQLGAGGMGAVWRALDRAVDEEVAVKVLLAGGSCEPVVVERFRRELKLARKISHPNVCRVFDLGEADGLRFLTMELVEGKTLRAVLLERAIAPRRALSLLQQVASGLAAVHEQGIIHRDLKPENVLVRRDGQALVADFGLARGALAQASTDSIVGTLAYMSPEQLRGEPLGPASDIFSLGILAFELLTGRSPFGSGAPATLMSAILRDAPQRLEGLALPAGAVRALDALLARAMAKRPEERFPTAGSFVAALGAVIADLDAEPRLAAAGAPLAAAGAPLDAAGAPLDAAGTTLSLGREAAPAGAMNTTLQGDRAALSTTLDSTTVGVRPSVPAADAASAGGRASLKPRWRRVGAAVAAASALGLAALAFRAGAGGQATSLRVAPPEERAQGARSAPAEDTRPAIVVMPFDNLTDDPSWDGLGQGAAETILGGLRTLPQVRALDSARPGDPAAEALRRGAAWVVTGTLQRVGASLRLSAQLRATDGPVAGEPIEIDGEPGDLPRLLEVLRDRAKDEVRLVWRDHHRRERAARGTSDAAARARLLQYYTLIGPAPRPHHHAEGKRLLDEALAADPGYVPALAERAYLQSLHAYAEGEPSLYASALGDLDRALARAPDDAQALVMRCRVLQVKRQAQGHATDADNQAALDACEAARHADPGSADVLLVFARLYDETCQNELIDQVAEQAIELDRSLSGRVLRLRIMLAVREDRWEVADRASLRLLAFEDEQRTLGARGVSRRMGVLPEPGARLLRAAVLLRQDRLDEARRELSEELAADAGARADRPFEAASIRGLLRVARQKGEPANARLEQRLAVLERQFQDGAAKNPHVATAVAGAYLWTDPDAAADWLGRVGAPSSFGEAYHRALAYRMAGKHAAARAALAARAPSERWEQACATWLRSRLSP